MQFAELVPIAAEAGLLGVIAGIFGMLHRSAVKAYREQTADWKETARLEREAHDRTREQLLQVLRPLQHSAEQAS